ncbi:3-hexulose-6-phosphate synthase [Candidatus Aciduliprofundum boonei]|uniref:3-hexulose-6-phosphate synthase n=1 Tax=Aciduliprofundum boonei (strain DSM 19572 / T469) TaxID=439481 RepID=B5IA94_ACIB4|nr:3-hexulose-6-phosphate synthase [Candidatus Aciduliprofundum boonei]ADD08268.1 Orotidine 5'-phosphate decarboxylase [Aciduliprofundum boonei T469]EDY36784.1 Thiamine monophosphate synthase/TENI subfamily, putative [Aciduliprofundum boonei T469]HII55034.1 bifunctional hexulose-6-phosphate synthase/ribonuclease regulator [Candidatus Aciduliprofundum boonei]
MPILQVALDFMILERALKVADEAVKGGADWIEVGTPLIKSEGMRAVREIKRRFKKTVVADLKTMDVGRVEVEMATKSGASVVTVLSLADDSTIEDSIKAARKYGARVMVDLINHPEPAKRAKEVEKLGADYVCVHVGVDQQMLGKNPLEILREVASTVSIPVAAAGGINSETAADIVKNGADIVIVGGAIIKAPNVEEAARKIKEAIEKGIKIKSELYKKYGEEELKDAFMKVSTPNLSDAMHRKGALGDFIKLGGGKVVGKAVTVRTLDGDWAKAVEAIDVANPGDVIVIDAQDGKTAVWGELATWSCKVKGIAGVVIYGAARDVDEIKKADYPVFARHIAPNAGEPKGFGEIGVELNIMGVKIKPGDWIIGDESGIAVVPREDAVEIANRALDVMEHENRIREEIKRGGTLSSVMELEKWEVER